MGKTLAKTETATFSIVMLLSGLFFELTILLYSFLKGSLINFDWMFALAQIIPLIFIDVAIKRIKEIDKIKSGSVDANTFMGDVDTVLSEGRRIKSTFKATLFIVAFSILLIGFLIFAWTQISSKGIEFNLQTAYTFGFLVLYLIIIRPVGKMIGGKMGGLGGIEFSFDKQNLLLKIQGKIARIPLKEIDEYRILTSTETIALQQSFNRQPGVNLTMMKDLMDFKKGKIPYPRYYQMTFGGTRIYLKGKSLAYLISVKNAQGMIDGISQRKA